MENKIVMLSSEQLEHHPDNPRKNIGDITELSASIVQDGILQNLTVVPKPDEENKYYVVIGNRRLEAGLAAGLTAFPCYISNMDHNKQLETMLVENMTRTDLTPLEEAEGFQQLTLVGFTVDEIAVKTGFSKSTINRRLKIAQYNHKKTQDAIERGGTLNDFIKIESLKRKEDREKMLKFIGTSDFNLEFKRAYTEQTKRENITLLRKLLKGQAKELKSEETDYWNSSCKYDMDYKNESIDITKPYKKKAVKLTGKYAHYFCFENSSDCLFYKDKEKKNVSDSSRPKKTEEEKAKDRKVKKLNALAKEFYELRSDFINKISEQKNIKDYKEICFDFMVKMAYFTGSPIGICFDYNYLKNDIFTEKGYNQHREEFYNTFLSYFNEHSAGIIVERIYSSAYDSTERNYHNRFRHSSNYSCYQPSKPLDVLYEFLTALGYEMSEEEKQYQAGTHELFVDEGA